jgi:hypothetical protein
MADPSSFAKLVPGFDFLEALAKNAGSALPGIGQWVAPTLNPQEIEKRIEELRTVQFWLEQNARMLGATIQALEVQRMTLSTLKTMNVQMSDLRDSLLIPTSTLATEVAAADAVKGKAAAAGPAPSKGGPAAAEAARPASPPGVDPLQWWGALTKQFTELAAAAIKDGASGAAKGPADAASAIAASATSARSARAPGKTTARPAAKARRTASRSRG